MTNPRAAKNPETGALQELARQPGRRFQLTAAAFEQSNSGLVPMVVDPSRGALLTVLGIISAAIIAN